MHVERNPISYNINNSFCNLSKLVIIKCITFTITTGYEHCVRSDYIKVEFEHIGIPVQPKISLNIKWSYRSG